MSKKIKAEEYMNWDKNLYKKLSPLEALKRMIDNGYVSPNVKELKIIETALKDYEHPRKEGFKQDNRLRLAYQEMGRYSFNKETPQELRGKPYGDIIGIVPIDEERRWDLYLLFNMLLNRPIHEHTWDKDKNCFIEYPCLLQELENRGYDVKTIYFEISKKDKRKKYTPYKTYLYHRENLNLDSKTDQKKLKALEIIKEKFFTDEPMIYSDLYKYGLCIDAHVSLTPKEYELLKEVLL